MSLEENRALVRTFLTGSIREARTLAELCAPGATFHIGGTPVMDLAAFTRYQALYYAAFTGSEIAIAELVAEGGGVAFRAVVHATHTAPFMGIPASGRRIAVPTIGIAHVVDGRIAEWWNSPDRLSWMQQIGAVKA